MNILFIDSAHPYLFKTLSDSGHVCKEGYSLTVEEIFSEVKNIEGIIVRSRIKINKQFIDRALNLKFIGRVGAGMEGIDVTYAEAKGIKCFNAPEGNRDSVAEHTVGMLLMLLNNLNLANQQVRNGEWIREGNRGTELMGKTVGVIGYGNMGSAFAQRLYGFNVNVLAYDKFQNNYGNQFVKEVPLEEIFKNADILSLHVPFTPETEFMVDGRFIKSFSKNIYIINTSRGKCLKTDDLVANLKSGKVKGACLDVNEYEDLSFEGLASFKSEKMFNRETWDYLVNSKKVILTPHIAGWSFESSEKMANILAEKIMLNFR